MKKNTKPVSPLVGMLKDSKNRSASIEKRLVRLDKDAMALRTGVHSGRILSLHEAKELVEIHYELVAFNAVLTAKEAGCSENVKLNVKARVAHQSIEMNLLPLLREWHNQVCDLARRTKLKRPDGEYVGVAQLDFKLEFHGLPVTKEKGKYLKPITWIAGVGVSDNIHHADKFNRFLGLVQAAQKSAKKKAVGKGKNIRNPVSGATAPKGSECKSFEELKHHFLPLCVGFPSLIEQQEGYEIPLDPKEMAEEMMVGKKAEDGMNKWGRVRVAANRLVVKEQSFPMGANNLFDLQNVLTLLEHLESLKDAKPTQAMREKRWSLAALEEESGIKEKPLRAAYKGIMEKSRGGNISNPRGRGGVQLSYDQVTSIIRHVYIKAQGGGKVAVERRMKCDAFARSQRFTLPPRTT